MIAPHSPTLDLAGHTSLREEQLTICALLVAGRELRPESVELTRTVAELFPELPAYALASCALLLEAPSDGHTCLDSSALARRIASAEWYLARTASPDAPPPTAERRAALTLAIDEALGSRPDFCGEWRTDGDHGPPATPLVRRGERYYAQRYAQTERSIAQALIARARRPAEVLPFTDEVAAALDTALPHQEARQRDAVRSALQMPFLLLTGGPGTGKTWTVRNVLTAAIARALRAGEPIPRIALAAPTGKAAARMLEALMQDIDAYREQVARPLVDGNEAWFEALSATLMGLEPLTLHRLLGISGPAGAPQTGHRSLINADFVVVDEVSMVDANLMRDVFRALPAHAKLILIGDPNQLASVDAGSVLADLVELAGREPVLTPLWVQLNVSRRFTADSQVGRLATAALAGDIDSPDWAAVLRPLRDNEALPARCIEDLADGYAPLLAAATDRNRPLDARASNALDTLERFQVLCTHRTGPRSVPAVNEALIRHFSRTGQMQQHEHQPLQPGMPILIWRNDYALGRFNGDIGVVVEPGLVSFREDDGSVRHIAAARLPLHQVAFAITVHKSQGSEWRDVAFLLPAHDARLLTKQLVYTALSRAKSGLRVYGDAGVLHRSIRRSAERASGLVEVVHDLLQHTPP